MRVIGGLWKGRTIYPPKGSSTRPTTDRVRESLMSSLISIRGSFEGACVLDAFAGSGALGIEVLSRGGSRAMFCEKDRNALIALTRNLDIVGVGTQTRPQGIVRRGDCLSRPPHSVRAPYDIVFFDPPYALAEIEIRQLLAALDESGSLQENVLIAYEHSVDVQLPDEWGIHEVLWEKAQAKRYGETAIDIYRKALL